MVTTPVNAVRFALVLVVCAVAAPAETHVYVGQLGATSALIAWGDTNGTGNENTIGRDSRSMGHARLQIGGQTIETDRNWAEVHNLTPDTAYPYDVTVNGKKIGDGSIRTHPARSTSLTFFVLGDFGTGDSYQHAIADAMVREFEKREQSASPVRFVITVGDNIYADTNLGYIIMRSGSQDKDWEKKLFGPYGELMRHIPFLPSLGNHDGNSSENRADLTTYMDNFFFPENKPARWYEFSYGGLADFFALDSTENTTAGHPAPIYYPGGEESNWLQKALAASTAPWKIPYFHHPPFNAGPGHGASSNVLRHWLDMFQQDGVKVVFSGHEHNFQFSEDSAATGHIRYIVSGAGGELRPASVMAAMSAAHIEGWAPQRHFCVVEIEGTSMHITPISSEPVVVRGPNGAVIPMPIIVNLK